MSILSAGQVTNYAMSAGFSGKPLSIIVAIARAESGFNDKAVGVNTDGSLDRGLVQINSRWHPEVSANQAFDPLQAMVQAWRISSHGASFTPWATFNNGAYKQYLNLATGSSTGSGSSGVGGSTGGGTSGGGGGGGGSNGSPVGVAGGGKITGNKNIPDAGSSPIESGYKYVLAYTMIILFLVLVAKTKLGYNAIYYSLALGLLLLVVTESKFIIDSLAPISASSGNSINQVTS